MTMVTVPERSDRRNRRIDWTPRPGKPDWLMGTGASAAERALGHGTAAVGTIVVLWAAAGLGWSWWQYAAAAALAYDLVGGVVANGLNSVKRFYQGPVPEPRTVPRRLFHDEVGFAAVHLQPVVVGLLFGATWWWGPLWYAWALAGVIAVRRSPLYLARPVGLLVVVAGLLAAPLVPAPAGWAWLPGILLLKLVVSHAVPEEPYARDTGEAANARRG